MGKITCKLIAKLSHDQIFYILSTGINLLSAESCITQYWVKLFISIT